MRTSLSTKYHVEEQYEEGVKECQRTKSTYQTTELSVQKITFRMKKWNTTKVEDVLTQLVRYT